MRGVKVMQPQRYLPDRIARHILQQVEEGTLKPGDVLPTEAALAADFGVSRNVLREAIARLRSDGVIETKQGRGAIITPLSARKTFRIDLEQLDQKGRVADLFELRGLLEIDAAGLAAQRRTQAHLLELEAAVDALRGATDFDETRLEADAQFHRVMGQATGNVYLTSIIDYLSSRLKDTVRATGEIYKEANLLAVTVAEHEAVLAAVRMQDSQAARDRMAAHIAGAAQRLGL